MESKLVDYSTIVYAGQLGLFYCSVKCSIKQSELHPKKIYCLFKLKQLNFVQIVHFLPLNSNYRLDPEPRLPTN